MVEEQLIPRGIKNPRVLGAFRKVERHLFVPEKFRDSAYSDYPLPVGHNQTISQPFIAALMTERLALKGREKVLEIGSGSGYQAAILAELAEEVYSVERIKDLADTAASVLKNLGYDKVHIKLGDGTLGWNENAPFDGIIVTAGAPHIPKSLVSQLANGGVLVIPVGGTYGQVMTVLTKTTAGYATEECCGCAFVPLVGKEGWREEA